MGIIMINCPATGRRVSTGTKMVCPACGRMHDWTKADAWLVPSGEQYRLGAMAARAISRHRPPGP
jgi:hypothetical protein